MKKYFPILLVLLILPITFYLVGLEDKGNIYGLEEKNAEEIKDHLSKVEDNSRIEDEPVESELEADKHLESQVSSTGLSKAVFSVSPIAIQNITGIIPLGALSPPSHVFPTDHIYFTLKRSEGADRPEVTRLYSPGDLIITSIRATQHVKAGITDYVIFLEPSSNPSISVMFIHVSSLSPEVFGDSLFQSWSFESEYMTGGETYRTMSKMCSIRVEAGEVLGEVGGNPGQWALDLGVYDLGVTTEMVANPERWAGLRYIHSVNPLDYFEEGLELEALWTLVQRTKLEGDETPCGSVLQDVPGTAQGCWFLSGIRETYPEDPHLALVHSNYEPEKTVFSVGTSIPHLESKRYEFLPNGSEHLNRDFREVSPDGGIYYYMVEGFNGVILLHMPDSSTLWIEAIKESSLEDNPSFTENKTIFVR